MNLIVFAEQPGRWNAHQLRWERLGRVYIFVEYQKFSPRCLNLRSLLDMQMEISNEKLEMILESEVQDGVLS